MNCGPHSLDPRSAKERLFQCTDCCVEPLQIIAFHVHPPIPLRCYDWRSEYVDGDISGPFGWGASREEAIADLCQNAQALAQPGRNQTPKP